MIEDLLGEASWPLALIIVAAIAAIAIFGLHSNDNDTRFRVACVQAGGTVGEHHGDPTCVGAR